MLLSRRDMSCLVLLTTGLLANIIPDAKAEIPLVLLTNIDSEPLGGQPPQGSAPSTADFDCQIKYQRAGSGDLGGARHRHLPFPRRGAYGFRSQG